MLSSSHHEGNQPEKNAPFQRGASEQHAISATSSSFDGNTLPRLHEIDVTTSGVAALRDGRPEITVQLKRDQVEATVIVHDDNLNTLKLNAPHPILYIPGLSHSLFNPFAVHADDETSFCYISLDVNTKQEGTKNTIHIPNLSHPLAAAELALAWLRQEQEQKVILSGFSLGGLIAAKLASSNEGDISALMLMSPTFLPPIKAWLHAYALNRGSQLLQGVKEYFYPSKKDDDSAAISPGTFKTLREALDTSDHYKIFRSIEAPIQISISQEEGFSKAYFESLLSIRDSESYQLDIFQGKEHSPDNPWKIVAALDFFTKFHPETETP